MTYGPGDPVPECSDPRGHKWEHVSLEFEVACDRCKVPMWPDESLSRINAAEVLTAEDAKETDWPELEPMLKAYAAAREGEDA